MDAITIAHISDLHFGDADPIALSAARDALMELKPDVIAVSGDLTQAGRAREFQDAAAYLSTLPFPQVVTPGNHDAPVFNLLSRIANPKKRYRRLLLATSWNDASRGVRVRAFDTARAIQLRRDWSQGVYDLGALDETLHEGGRLILVAHHTPITPPNAPVESDTRNGKRALDRMAKHDGLVLLAGHTHRFYVGRLGGNGPVTIVAPSLASSRVRGDKNGFVVVRTGEHGLSAALHTFDGKHFEEAQRESIGHPPEKPIF